MDKLSSIKIISYVYFSFLNMVTRKLRIRLCGLHLWVILYFYWINISTIQAFLLLSLRKKKGGNTQIRFPDSLPESAYWRAINFSLSFHRQYCGVSTVVAEDLPGFKFWVCCLLHVWLWSCYWISLHLFSHLLNRTLIETTS